MLTYLLELDTRLFLYLNSLHSNSLEGIMWFLSLTKVWIPLYIIIAAYIFWKYRKTSIFIIITLALTIVASDRLSSGLIKPLVKRYRPSHEAKLEGKVHMVNNYKGGKYGFVSSHAANTFALALFLSLLLKRKLITGLFFLWATLVSYSRIYLGVHYPGDVLGGALIGCLCAFILFKIMQHFLKRNFKIEFSKTE